MLKVSRIEAIRRTGKSTPLKLPQTILISKSRDVVVAAHLLSKQRSRKSHNVNTRSPGNLRSVQPSKNLDFHGSTMAQRGYTRVEGTSSPSPSDMLRISLLIRYQNSRWFRRLLCRRFKPKFLNSNA
jgi:hypothetical protein